MSTDRNVVFARTRHLYQSYTDFFRLVELSGYPWRYLDEINWNDPTLIVIATTPNAEWREHIPSPRPRSSPYLIHWMLERGVSDDPDDMAYPAKHPYADALWVSDRAFAKQLRAQYVFLGGHQAFAKINMLHRNRYDYTSLAYMNPRRQQVQIGLRMRGLTDPDSDGGVWDEARIERLNSVKLLINIHQDDQCWHEPLRFMIAACYAVPLVSESCDDPGRWTDSIHYLDCPVDALADSAHCLLSNDVVRSRLAAAAWRLACVEHPFRREVEVALR